MRNIVDYFDNNGKGYGREVINAHIEWFDYIAKDLTEHPEKGEFQISDDVMIRCRPESFLALSDFYRRKTEEQIQCLDDYSERGKTFIALEGNEFAGAANVYPETGNTACNSYLIKRRGCKRNGIGRELFKEREKFTVENLGISLVRADSIIYTPTIDFHRRRGYTLNRFAGSFKKMTADDVRKFIKFYLIEGTEIAFPRIKMVKELKSNPQ